MGYDPVYRPSHATAKPAVVISQQGLLIVKTANQTIKDAISEPIPKKLCGDLWFEGESAILFADTNLGKSIMAVQIADGITRGNKGGATGSEAEPQSVLYLDYELSDKQFEKRYSVEYDRHYLWDSKFMRVKINPFFLDFEDFEKQMFTEIEGILENTGCKILIVDNITYLKMQSTESGKEAMSLMKQLTQLKHKYRLSLLVLAHTPKRQNLSSPLTLNDLAGSKQLSNFADSIFCVGKSHQDSGIRYVKQLKARSCPVEEEVYLFRLEKNHNFLGFTFEGRDKEYAHLKSVDLAKSELTESIIKTKQEHPDWSLQKVADETGAKDKMTVQRILKKHSP